jgi:hypothetical protein
MKANAKKEVPEVTAEQLAKVLQEKGIPLFRERTGLPLNQAQRNLEGLTHYVDDKTVASFKAKIHSVHVMEEGLMLCLVESVQAGPNAESGRVFRPVFFDVFGNTIYKPSIDDSDSTLKAANLSMWKQADEIDIIKATIEGVETKRDACQKQAEEYNELLEEIK